MSDQILPSRVKDLTHQKFGDLLVLHFSSLDKHRQANWQCVCHCGNRPIVNGCHLRSGHSTSCGSCLKFLSEEKYSELLEDQILSNITKTEQGCWEYTASRDAVGYGMVSVRKRGVIRAHVVSYELFRGSTNGLFVLHKCDNPPCCRPDHLFLGTHLINMQDKVQKNRQVKGVKNGMAKLTQTQVEEIRKMYVPHTVTMRMIGKLFKVSSSTILSILKHDTWKL